MYVDYHPIVVADTRQVFGYEALARGTLRTLRSPEVMFDVAAEADLLWELSRLCRSKAIEAMKNAAHARRAAVPQRRPARLRRSGVQPAAIARSRSPQRVVIEITERTAIKDYPKFRERLKAFRERGYRFAVDDAGSGYAGLGSIANLEPDFIKLDISLINCIDTNFIKQNLVETMVRFANDQGAMVIAEGVERAEEFETVKELGVHLVQGFFLHRPSENAVARTTGETAAVRAAGSDRARGGSEGIAQFVRLAAPVSGMPDVAQVRSAEQLYRSIPKLRQVLLLLLLLAAVALHVLVRLASAACEPALLPSSPTTSSTTAPPRRARSTSARAPAPACCDAASVEPRAEPRLERRFRGLRRTAATRDEQLGVAAVRVARPEQHRHAERRRLEHRVQPRGVKSPADVRDVRQRIQIAEHADAIDDHDVRVRCVASAEPGERATPLSAAHRSIGARCDSRSARAAR